MKVTVIPGDELSDDLIRIWLQLQEGNHNLASPYFHPEFTKTIANVRDDVEVAVIESAGGIDAFFPFQREHGMISRPVGGIISDYHGAISEQDFRFSPRELLKQSGLAAWEFDHLPATQLSFVPFHWSTEASPQIDISRGYNDYVQQRRRAGSEQIKKIYNLRRRLEREIGPLSFVADSTDGAALAKVLAWKSAQYHQSGKRDLFALGWIREAIQRIFAMHTDGCSGVLSLLYAGDRLVAGHFGMRSRRMWHYWFPSYDPEVAKYSPGLILLLKMTEGAPEIGIPIIDLGKGMSLYKERLMNSYSLLASGRIESFWRSMARRTWRTMRSRLRESPLGPVVHEAREWLRRPDRDGAGEKAPFQDGVGADRT
jgi:CelD/BcsL family acetyltransferase involved in cellulose biosynthesis